MACTSQTVPKSSEGKGYEYPINSPPFYQTLGIFPGPSFPFRSILWCPGSSPKVSVSRLLGSLARVTQHGPNKDRAIIAIQYNNSISCNHVCVTYDSYDVYIYIFIYVNIYIHTTLLFNEHISILEE